MQTILSPYYCDTHQTWQPFNASGNLVKARQLQLIDDSHENHEQSVTAKSFRHGTPVPTWRLVEAVGLTPFLPSLDAQVHVCQGVHR